MRLAAIYEACYLVSTVTAELLPLCILLAARMSGRTQAVVTVTFIYIAHAVVAVACVPKSQSAAVAEQCQAMSAACQQDSIKRLATAIRRAIYISALRACRPSKAAFNSE